MSQGDRGSTVSLPNTVQCHLPKGRVGNKSSTQKGGDRLNLRMGQGDPWSEREGEKEREREREYETK